MRSNTTTLLTQPIYKPKFAIFIRKEKLGSELSTLGIRCIACELIKINDIICFYNRNSRNLSEPYKVLNILQHTGQQIYAALPGEEHIIIVSKIPEFIQKKIEIPVYKIELLKKGKIIYEQDENNITGVSHTEYIADMVKKMKEEIAEVIQNQTYNSTVKIQKLKAIGNKYVAQIKSNLNNILKDNPNRNSIITTYINSILDIINTNIKKVQTTV